MHWIIILLFYLLLGLIGSNIYHFNGIVDILLWPIVIPLKLLLDKNNK